MATGEGGFAAGASGAGGRQRRLVRGVFEVPRRGRARISSRSPTLKDRCGKKRASEAPFYAQELLSRAECARARPERNAADDGAPTPSPAAVAVRGAPTPSPAAVAVRPRTATSA